VCDTLQARSTVAGLDLVTWQECLSSACETSRQAEKPLANSSSSSSASTTSYRVCAEARAATLRSDLLAGRATFGISSG